MTQTASRRSRSDYQQFRAPSDDGSVLIHPTNTRLDDLALQTFQGRKSDSKSFSLAGVPLEELSQRARHELVGLSHEWTSSYLPESLQLPEQPCPIILSGHQPELYHSGVWFKNFLLNQIAERTSGIGINLIIDSDLCREVSIRVPYGEGSHRRVELIKYDDSIEPTPFEERAVQNQEFFNSFPDRVSKKTNDFLSKESVLSQIWPLASDDLNEGQSIGNLISRARHQIERAYGSQTFELPISHVADTDSFRHFLIELLSRADEFRTAYNGSLDDYRAAHRLRTPAQPLPNLAHTEGWIETPFWIWHINRPERKPLWCRSAAEGIEFTDTPGAHSIARISNNVEEAVKQLKHLRVSGVKIRSRALATTLYCRWVLADLFIHGIGGAKYDQITDQISIQFFGKAPPQHATATATIRLFPSSSREVSREDFSSIKHRLREYRFHPEKFLSDEEVSAEIQQAIVRKQNAIQLKKTASNAHDRHQAIEQSNQALMKVLSKRMDTDREELDKVDEKLKWQPITTSREYSFVLFDKSKLMGQLQQLAEEVII